MASESGSTESTQSKIIKATVLVVVLAAAAIFYFRSRGDGGQLDTAESASLYVCPADGATLNVTPKKWDDMRRSGDVGPPEGAGARGSGQFVRCPTCKKRVMVEAKKCPKDGTAVPIHKANGDPGVCPKCGWKAAE